MDHLFERGLAWSEHDIVGALPWILDVPANQEPVTPLPFFLGDLQTPQWLPRPVIQPWALRSVARGEPMPTLRSHRRGDLSGFRLSKPLPPQGFIRLHAQHKGLPSLFQSQTESAGTTVDGIAGHPAARNSRIQRPSQHLLRQLWLGRKRHIVGNTRLVTTLLVRYPLLRQIQRPIQERRAVLRRIAEKHSHLAVLDPSCRAAVLSLHPDRSGSLLQETRLVHHENGLWIAQMLHYVGTQVVAHPIRVPTRSRQEALHAVGT